MRRSYHRGPTNLRRRASAPTQLVQPVVVDTEVMGELVHDGDGDLVDHLLLGVTHLEQSAAIDRDHIGQGAGVVAVALGQRHTLVEPEQIRLVGMPILDQHDDVVDGRREREYAPTLAALREVATEAAADGTPEPVQSRIAETLETMQMFDDWYAEMARLPRGTQLMLLKLGAKIARFLPKGPSNPPDR